MKLSTGIPSLALLAACTERAPIAEPTPVSPVVTAPAPEPKANPTAEPEPEPAPAPRPPPQLQVAFEGHCLGLGSAMLDDEIFVSYVESFAGPGVIHRLGPDARPQTMLPKLDAEDGVADIYGFEGRWPTQAFLEIGTGYRDSYDTSHVRFDGTAWSPVKLGAEGKIRRVFPWYEDSILALGCADTCAQLKLMVIRGKPKAPRLDRALATLGACKYPKVDALAVIESGAVVGVVSCESEALGTVAIRWSPDDLAGDAHRLLPVGEKGDVVVADDRAAIVYLAVNGEKGPALIESRAGAWKELTLPAGERVNGLAIDPRGALWLLRKAGLWRRSGEAWAQEAVGFEGLTRMVGVERGAPWVHTNLDLETRLARRDADGTWHAFVMPHSALFADQQLRPEYARVDAQGELWMDATYARRRKGPTSPLFRFEAILTTRPPSGPVLRCGDALNQDFSEPFFAWPHGADERCSQRLVLVQKRWKLDDTYPKLRKLVKRSPELAAARFIELEIAGAMFVAAYVDTADAAAALVLEARKLRSSSYPEVICGDPKVLTAAGARVHRELALAPATKTP